MEEEGREGPMMASLSLLRRSCGLLVACVGGCGDVRCGGAVLENGAAPEARVIGCDGES